MCCIPAKSKLLLFQLSQSSTLLHSAGRSWLCKKKKKDLLAGVFRSNCNQLLESVDLLVTRIGVISTSDRYLQREMHTAHPRVLLRCIPRLKHSVFEQKGLLPLFSLISSMFWFAWMPLIVLTLQTVSAVLQFLLSSMVYFRQPQWSWHFPLLHCHFWSQWLEEQSKNARC